MDRSFRAITFLIAILISTQALSKPHMGSELMQALKARGDNELITVVALFKDRNPVPKADYKTVVEFKKQNALNVQKNFSLFSNNAIKAKYFWLINAAVLKAPVGVVKALHNNEDIRSLELDQEMHLIEPIEETKAFKNTDYTYGLQKMNIPQLRKQYPELDGRGIRVGIVDTGIDPNHPDLKDKTILWKDFTGLNSKTPMDDWSHGTHVAGTIAGADHAGKNIGVAPNAEFVIARIFSKQKTATWSQIIEAMQWIADPDGDPSTADQPLVINNSWGGGRPYQDKSWKDQTICQAVQGWRDLNILPVFSIGNNGTRGVGLPGGCPNAFSVGATDRDDEIASFSSRGPAIWKEGSFTKPDISAPGVDVFSSLPNGGGYGTKSGTSMASPHVTGMAALLMQKSPGKTIEEYEQLIIDGSVDLGDSGKDDQFGEGRVDALKSINEVR